MNKQEAIKSLRSFLGWFEDNFFDESYLVDDDTVEGDTIKEKWISYLDYPDYLRACEALDSLEKMSES